MRSPLPVATFATLALIGALVTAPPAAAQPFTSAPQPAQSAPAIGQVSKDSVWVPTPERLIHRLLQLADVTARDTVLDLGSGDGRVPIYAAKYFGARAIGVELEENLIRVSNEAARASGVAHRVRFVRQDLFETDLAQASVITLYISPGVMTRLKPRLLALKPGTRIVSHQFTLDDWEPDESIRSEGRMGYLWVVPGNVAGTWTIDGPGDALRIEITQKYQSLTLRGERAGKPVAVIGGRLRGNEISFSSFDADGTSRHFRGRVSGSRMDGESERDGTKPLRWRATRAR
jgi:SAM-dependent methyltransferase